MAAAIVNSFRNQPKWLMALEVAAFIAAIITVPIAIYDVFVKDDSIIVLTAAPAPRPAAEKPAPATDRPVLERPATTPPAPNLFPNRPPSNPPSPVTPSAQHSPILPAPTPPALPATALGGFFDAANGINWDVATSWKSSAPVCEWHGVGCDEQGRVTSLNLKKNNMYGSISTSIGLLEDLTFIDFDSNYLAGPIPTELGRLASLRHFEADDNRLTGTVPSELGGLRDLKEVYLQTNDLSGVVPSELCARRIDRGGELDTLVVDCNAVECGCCYPACPSVAGVPPAPFPPVAPPGGMAPASPAAALGEFYDAANGVNWEIATNWKSSAPVCEWHGVGCDEQGRVTTLDLKKNNMYGSISTYIGLLEDLTFIDFDSNYLAGPIPTELGRLASLRHFEVDDNRLTGTVPSELGGLRDLKEVYLQTNDLSGVVPSELCARRIDRGGELDTLIADCEGDGNPFERDDLECGCCSACY